MLDKDKKVQGVGVYAEFTRSGEALQLLVTPDLLNTEGELVPMAVHRRVVTKATPKRQWKMNNPWGSIASEYMGSGGEVKKPLSQGDISAYVEKRFAYSLPILDEILTKGWEIVKVPILVEVSQIDADDIKQNKTPNKILYRVGISKKSLGFPDELI